jgi:hypothetical protein
MSRCHFCHWGHGGHDEACPEVAKNKERAHTDRRRGWDDGRAGKAMPEAENRTYKLGWVMGTAALEEAQNGYDPRFND